MGGEEKEVRGCVHGRWGVFIYWYQVDFHPVLCVYFSWRWVTSSIQIFHNFSYCLKFRKGFLNCRIWWLSQFMVREKQPCLWIVQEWQGSLSPLEEAVLKLLSPVHKRKHLTFLEWSGLAPPSLERSSLCMWPWPPCVSVSSSESGNSTFVGVCED